MKKLFLFIAILFAAMAHAQDITGKWYGLLEFQTAKVKLVFNISKTTNGYLSTMDSPDQGAKDIPVQTTTFENGKLLTLEIPMAQIKLTASLGNDGVFVGKFSQAGTDFPISLTREMQKAKRPQEPKAPFPYYSENVTFENTKEHFNLSGTLTLPKKEGKFPVVVLISGSGAQNRDSELLEHKPFLVIADHLTRAGIGVLRFDDRGVGESKGNRANATSKDFADDVQAAVNYLKTRKDVNLKKIGLAGHSEGGIIAPMVAANSKDIAFIILLAGTGIPGDQLLSQQSYLIGKASGMSEVDLQKAKELNDEIYGIIKSENDPVVAKTKLSAALTKQFEALPETQKPTAEQLRAVVDEQSADMSSPWLRYFIMHNPADVLKDVKCPVLVLNGSKDLQVPADTNTKAIKEALEKNGNKKVTVNVLPGLNHLFQEAKTGLFDEYGQIEQTFSPVALKAMSDWILQQTK